MDAIQESLTNLQQMFTQRMDIYQGELAAASAVPAATITSLSAEFTTFRTFIMSALKSLQEQVALLSSQADNLESQSRRKILLLHGVPETTSEDTVSVVVHTIATKMKLENFSAADIKQCHRMGQLTSDRPRTILFKIANHERRTSIWKMKSALKGTGITLSEFLTKHRHDTFMAARQKFGISKCWTNNGSVFVIIDGMRHRINTMSEFEKLNKASTSKSGETVNKAPASTRESRAASKSKRAAGTGASGKK
ncbi:uncharacterized protein LOC123723296 [Papilio machaon]|uniref:uncharacterized protein LOC123723296 n=1 Tax=Papilio machaon TaxID=76193 RepID=UPI001E66508D|nr:uncharacterized protein LOC123723296 [Papilio machaon]